MKNIFKIAFAFFVLINSLFAMDLKEVKASGELRHLGIPYANFVTGLGDGLDVELIKGFAKHLGVKYVYIPSNWDDIYGQLTGQNVAYKDSKLTFTDKKEIKGDLIANGLTILPWRKEVVNFSTPTFPSSVWLIAKSSSLVEPISPSNSLDKDIQSVKALMKNQKILTRPNTCLDARLYNLDKTGSEILIHEKEKSIIEMVPTIIQDRADLTLLDVPDAMIALEKWSGEIKVIGPVSEEQLMGVAFRKDSPELLAEFNKYFEKIKKDGTYTKIVEKYYPSIFDYYADFFK